MSEREQNSDAGILSRRAIVVAASRAFSRAGFHCTDVDAVSEQAGVERDILNAYFPSKDALAEVVLHEFSRRMVTFCEELLTLDGPALTVLCAGSLRWARLIASNSIVSSGVRLSIERADLLGEPIEGYDPWTACAEEFLDRAVAEGAIPHDVDVPAATRFLVGAFVGAQVLSRVYTAHDDLELRIEELWRHALDGLALSSDHTNAERFLARARVLVEGGFTLDGSPDLGDAL